jgi:hypothetical protein
MLSTRFASKNEKWQDEGYLAKYTNQSAITAASSSMDLDGRNSITSYGYPDTGTSTLF